MTTFSFDPAQAIALVVHEARLLDTKRFDDWYALFDTEGRYWMPLTRGQQDMKTQTSLMLEDKFLLQLRIERLKSTKAYSQQPASHCHHLLQTPSVEAFDTAARTCTLCTEFNYTEVRMAERLALAGTAHHHLVERDGALRILLKRVDLLECEAPLPSIQLFI